MISQAFVYLFAQLTRLNESKELSLLYVALYFDCTPVTIARVVRAS
jgi:hypothetical protein